MNGGLIRHIPHISLNSPHPNASEFIDILMGRSSEVRVPIVEYIVDDVVLRPIVTDLLGRAWVDYGNRREDEDTIVPVQEFQSLYGNRIAILGGLDINILSGSTPADVRSHTRFLVETCGARGRYAVGSGNSVPSYVPVENYLAMIDEAHATNSTFTNN